MTTMIPIEQDDDEPPASPLTSTEGAPKGSPSDAASQGGRDVPKAPKKDSPPMNSPIPHQTPDNNPAKGEWSGRSESRGD